MRRFTQFSLLALLSACSAKNGQSGTTLQAVGPGNPANTARITLASASTPSDGAPTLVTLQGRTATTNGAVYDVSTVGGAVRSIPPGGYIVRGTSGSTTPSTSTGIGVGYTGPAVTTTAVRDESGPAPGRRVATSHSTAGSDSRTRSSRPSVSAGGGYGLGSGVAEMDVAAVAPAAPINREIRVPTTSTSSTAVGALRAAPVDAAPITVAPPPPPGEVHVTVGITVPTIPQQVVEPENILTAASVGDVDRRDNYLEYLTRHAGEREQLGLDLSRRVRMRVIDATGRPINAAQITLSGMGINIAGQSHADGYWDFYPSVSAPQQLMQGGTLIARAEVQGVGVQANFAVPAMGDGSPVTLQIPAIVAPPQQATLDLGFAIDVTGSMGDELEYVHHEVGNIVQRIQSQNPGVRVRVGATFYRDRVDPVVVQQIPFTADVAGFANAMMGVRANGGGDYPEDMNAGLDAALSKMSWSDGAAVRVLVVIADAPPQQYPDAQFTYLQAMTDASRRGIRILPVAASGADRTVEYLFRAMGAFTSTPYVYLTDDSGVGGGHMEADTDRVGVEKFAELLVRMVSSDLKGEGMHEPGPLGPN